MAPAILFCKYCQQLYACIVAMSNKEFSLVSDSVWVTSVVLIRFGFSIEFDMTNPVVSDSIWVTSVVLMRFGFPHIEFIVFSGLCHHDELL